MPDEHQLSEQQFIEAQQALDIAALNGIVCLAVLMKKRGLVGAGDVEYLHEMISKPLSAPHNADNPWVQDAQQNLDQLFAALLDRA